VDSITFETIWPKVQVVLGLFDGVMGIIVVLFVAGMALGIFIKNMRA